jgi:hypothetical protein
MHFNALTLPLAPSDRLQQEAAASLCTGTADPSAADYLLVALLFAWHFNGDAAALKGWCSDAKINIRNPNATWRRTLAAVMKCRNGAVLAMAAHTMSTHFDVDIPAPCVMNYMTMHFKGKVLKSDAHGRQKPRMTAGDAEHFSTLITTVENLTTEQRNRMAGSEGRTLTPPRPRAGMTRNACVSFLLPSCIIFPVLCLICQLIY